jgi:hypothetical protein
LLNDDVSFVHDGDQVVLREEIEDLHDEAIGAIFYGHDAAVYNAGAGGDGLEDGLEVYVRLKVGFGEELEGRL